MTKPVGTVTFEDSGEQRVVKGFCERCQRTVSVKDYRGRMTSFSDVQIVSPSGIAHAGHYFREGATACGLDATGPDWWWRL